MGGSSTFVIRARGFVQEREFLCVHPYYCNNWQTSGTASITTSPWIRERPPTLTQQFRLNLQPLLCKPTEVRVAKWQEQWEAIPRATWRHMTSTQRNNSRVVTHCRGVHGGQPTECARDRLPPRQRSICGATGRAKPVCAARPDVISATL